MLTVILLPRFSVPKCSIISESMRIRKFPLTLNLCGWDDVAVLDQNPEQVRILNIYFTCNKHQTI